MHVVTRTAAVILARQAAAAATCVLHVLIFSVNVIEN